MQVITKTIANTLRISTYEDSQSPFPSPMSTYVVHNYWRSERPLMFETDEWRHTSAMGHHHHNHHHVLKLLTFAAIFCT